MNTYKIKREPDSLYHHGVKNMKWGIRRYQNEDGSYKPGAEGRYSFGKISGTRNTNPSHRGMPQLAGSGSGKKTSITAGKTYDGKKIGGGGGGGSPAEETEEEKKKVDRKNIHIYDVSEKLPEKGEKKKTGGKGSGGGGGKSSKKASETEKEAVGGGGKSSETEKTAQNFAEKNKEKSSFKPDAFYDRINGLELDDISDAELKEFDELIEQYNIYKQGNTVPSKKAEAIEDFISRYNAWKSSRRKNSDNLTDHGISAKKSSAFEKQKNSNTADMNKKRNRNVAITHSEELYHHGILGMKWGIRRYQNPDGSYTAEGKRRKSKGKEYSEDYWNAHDKKDPKYMSDKELQKRNNRLQQEQQYKALTKTKADKAKESVIKGGKKLLAATVGATVMAMAVKYSRENLPDLIEAGGNFIADSVAMTDTMSELMKKSRWLL